MEEKAQPAAALPRLLVTARPAKKPKKRKTEAEKTATKKASDKARAQTRVYIGTCFQRWRQLREMKGLQSDEHVAVYLMDSFEKDPSISTPCKHELMRTPPPAVSTVVTESLSSRLKQLAQYLILPVNMCPTKEPNKTVEYRSPGPFKVNVKSRGTAAVVEWVCPYGHTVFKWASQPTLKYGMLVGDFMLAFNILLSGNTYAKISLLFRFMTMGTVERSTLFRIQDSYCVDTVKEFWSEKRAAIITQLQPKGPVVALGWAAKGVCHSSDLERGYL